MTSDDPNNGCEGDYLVTGQAGTGKSRVVNAISDDCQQLDLRVSVICSSEIACLVYDPGVASTVLSLYGLGAADLPAELLMSTFDSADLCFNLRWVEKRRPKTQHPKTKTPSKSLSINI